MTLRFSLHTDVRAGEGIAAPEAAAWAADHGTAHASVVLDAGLRGNDEADRLVAALGDGREVDVVVNDVAEPDYDYLDDFRTRVRPDTGLVVAVGGGSTLDLAKATSVLLTNPKPALEYRGFDLIERPGPPVIAIPTTAGTGSEVTPNAVFTNKAEQRKLGINTALYLPKLALLDPRLVASAPRSVTVSAGMDALVHAVESFVAAGATPISRPLSREAFRLVMRWLPRAVDEPSDMEAHQQMQIGAFFAGSALMNAGAGPAGALSYPLGVRWQVPHGIAGGVFLAPVAQRNVAQGALIYGELADLLPDPPRDGSPQERAQAVADAIEELSVRIGVPRRLSEWGIGPADVDLITEETFGLAGALKMNPIVITDEWLRSLLGEMTAAS
jgi:alcohol dehydrogenase